MIQIIIMYFIEVLVIQTDTYMQQWHSENWSLYTSICRHITALRHKIQIDKYMFQN